jgi:hypothetical protein
MDTEEFLRTLVEKLEYYAVCYEVDGNKPLSEALQVVMTCVVQAAAEVAPKGSSFYKEEDNASQE